MATAGRPLLLSHSPLLSGCLNFGTTLSEDFFSTLEAQGISTPLPTFSFSPSPGSLGRPSPRLGLASPTQSVSAHHLAVPSQARRNHPGYTRTPVFRSRHPPIPPKEIIALLNLLDRLDDDTTRDVQRVRESIREARGEIAAAHEELEWEDEQLLCRRRKERRETKGVDDEFWLNA